MIEPGIFVGTLRHRRFAPVAHAFTYPVCMALLDVDHLASLLCVSRLTSYNRWNWASFDQRDHFGDPAQPLRERLAADAVRAGLELPDGRILLLTNLRYFGFCFNPISFFYCFDRGGVLRLVLAEVNNTFGGSHNYWLQPDAGAGPFRAVAEKALDVSPFMPADLTYAFALPVPSERLVAHVGASRAGVSCFDATLSLDRRPWTAGEIRRALIGFPAMTVTVMLSIHWQAIKLWWKGVPIVARTERPT